MTDSQMIRNFKIFALILPFFFLQNYLYSQTKDCDINFFDGAGLSNSSLIGQHEDLVLVSAPDNYKIVNIRRIKSIRFDNGTYLWSGVGLGAAAGFVGGLVLYEFMAKKNKFFLPKDASIGVGVIITIPCAIIGGIIGNLYKNIDNYDMSDMGVYMKSKELKFIIRDHSIWR